MDVKALILVGSYSRFLLVLRSMDTQLTMHESELSDGRPRRREDSISMT